MTAVGRTKMGRPDMWTSSHVAFRMSQVLEDTAYCITAPTTFLRLAFGYGSLIEEPTLAASKLATLLNNAVASRIIYTYNTRPS